MDGLPGQLILIQHGSDPENFINQKILKMNSINKSSQTLLAELEYETKIREELNDAVLYFDYEDNEDSCVLSLVTISKTHGQRFLFHRVLSHSRTNCLYEMLKYIQSDYIKNMEHYEINWAVKGENKTQKSWFYGKSFLDVISKFFHMKDSSEISIYEIKMMPMS